MPNKLCLKKPSRAFNCFNWHSEQTFQEIPLIHIMLVSSTHRIHGKLLNSTKGSTIPKFSILFSPVQLSENIEKEKEIVFSAINGYLIA